MWDDAKETVDRIEIALSTFDTRTVYVECDQLLERLPRAGGPFPAPQARRLLAALRSHRLFDRMVEVSRVLIANGQSAEQIQRQLCQGLIDRGNIADAIEILHDLVVSAKDPGEKNEAHGLLGRAHKQRYVDAAQGDPDELKLAFDNYWEPYRANPDATWHGINVVAVLCRAKDDKVTWKDAPDPLVIAGEILEKIEGKDVEKSASLFDFATAAEASLALNNGDVHKWLDRFLEQESLDAFAIASITRQLEQVWRLRWATERDAAILSKLQPNGLSKSGSFVVLTSGQIQLQKVHGTESYVPYQWYKKGLNNCDAVGRVENQFETGVGTGFLLKGTELCEAFGTAPVFITNAHVISPDSGVRGKHGSLAPPDARVVFKSRQPPVSYRVMEVLATQPPETLDYTIVRLRPESETNQTLGLADHAPGPENKRVYIIGYPKGEGLSLSLHDNLLLELSERLLRYRAPTEGGSSGSPVFDEQWDVVGLHHAGGSGIAKLNGSGVYDANEGISIAAIRQSLRSQSQAQSG